MREFSWSPFLSRTPTGRQIAPPPRWCVSPPLWRIPWLSWLPCAYGFYPSPNSPQCDDDDDFSDEHAGHGSEAGIKHQFLKFSHGRTSLGQKIIIVIGRKVGLCACLTAERLSSTDELQVVQTTGDALVAVAVESVQVDACTTVHAGVDLGAGQHRIAVGIHDTGSGSGVGIDEIGIGIGGIIRAFDVAVTKRGFDGCERR